MEKVIPFVIEYTFVYENEIRTPSVSTMSAALIGRIQLSTIRWPIAANVIPDLVHVVTYRTSLENSRTCSGWAEGGVVFRRSVSREQTKLTEDQRRLNSKQ
jgi:hypothetical protein